MKNIILLILITCLNIISAKAQTENIGGYEYRLFEKKSSVLGEVDGSPYLHQDFLYGSLQLKNTKSLKVFLRYNVAYEEFEIKLGQETDEVFVIPIEKNVQYNIGSTQFFLDKLFVGGNEVYGYFIELFNGDRYRLLKKPVVHVVDAVEAKNGFQDNEPAKISVRSNYYLTDKKGENRKLDVNKRKLKKEFNNEMAKRYLSKHRIKTSEDLVNFISYIDNSSTTTAIE
jgi:hypothetical protein